MNTPIASVPVKSIFIPVFIAALLSMYIPVALFCTFSLARFVTLAISPVPVRNIPVPSVPVVTSFPLKSTEEAESESVRAILLLLITIFAPV